MGAVGMVWFMDILFVMWGVIVEFFFLLIRGPPSSYLFPYTSLLRSVVFVCVCCVLLILVACCGCYGGVASVWCVAGGWCVGSVTEDCSSHLYNPNLPSGLLVPS